MTLPLAGSQEARSPMHFGYGDTEFSAKICFLHETGTLPQISFAPAFDVPPGSIGMIEDRNEQHKILFSFDRPLRGDSSFSGYGAYEQFIGPRPKTSASEDDVKS